MKIDHNIKKLGSVPNELIEQFANSISDVNWDLPEFKRNGDALPSRTVVIPFGNRPEPTQEQTDTVLHITTAVKPITNWLSDCFPNSILFKGEINYISPKSIIPFHIDPCWFHENSSRIHIPITTNDQTFWMSGTKLYNMPLGNYYEVDNRVLHSFWNNGDTSRIHLVIDVMSKNIYDHAIATGIDVNQQNIDPLVTDPTEILDLLTKDIKYSKIY
jgi:hypothetical protein